MIKGENNTTKKGIFLTGAVALLSMLVVLFIDGFYPFSDGSVAALDLHSQYIPILYRFYDTVTRVKNISVDFHIGGGLNMYSDTLTEILNPFNYVLLLFGRSSIYKSVNILLVLYVMAASMSAYLAFSKLFPKNSMILNTVLSLSYGMSYFNAYQYEIIRWLYIVVLFPLLVLALIRMLEKQKPLLFVLLLGYILVISLQFGIQLCMFSFVFSTCYLVKEAGGKLCDISGKHCLTAGLSLVTAVLISGVGTVPAVINLLGSARSVQSDSVLSVVTHHGLDNILERILEISGPLMWGGLLASILILKKEIKVVLKEHAEISVCFLILLVTVILEPSNLLWHLGSYQCFPVRYGYIVLWLGLMLVSQLYEACLEKNENFGKLTKSHVVPVICVLAGLAVGCFVYSKRLMFAQAFATLDISKMCRRETLFVYLILFILSLAAAFIFLGLCHGRNHLLSICGVAVVSLSGITWFMAVLLPQSSPARIFNEEAYIQMNSTASVETVEQYSGHVADDSGLPLNAALVTGEYSMSAYVPSGEGLEYVSAMEKLGYDIPWVSVTTNGGSDVSDRFLGLDGEYIGACGITKEEYETIGSVADMVEMEKQRPAIPMIFDNKKGQIRLQAFEGMDYLLLPVAYISGWNTDKGEITSYMGGFLAVWTKGENGDIVLDYSLPGFHAGVLFSLIGILILAITIFAGHKDWGLSRVAKYLYALVTLVFAVAVYVLPNIGMLVFMGAKAAGYDFSPYLESTKAAEENIHTLLSQSMEEDGLHVLIGCNNLLNDKGVKITASDEESADFRAARAIDGDEDSRWSSVNDWDSNDHYLQADFKEMKTVKAVNINWERTNACAYSIEISNDGENWSCVSEFNEPALCNPQIIYYEDGINTRYLRLHVTEVLKNEEDASIYYQNVSVREFEVYDDKCDSFVIAKPKLSSGYDRVVPIPEVPAGYGIKIGGINYDNLLNDKCFADTAGAVDITLGYELSYEGEVWDLEGFKLTLPSSCGDDVVASAFPYEGITVREWVPGEDFLKIEGATDVSNCGYVSEVIAPDMEASLGNEGYEIQITEKGIKLTASDEQGLCWGRVTLNRMLTKNRNNMPCGIIRDYPEYAVRGFVLDVARRPISMEFMYRIVDAMSDNYMNTLQLHFNDNAIISESEYDGSVEGARKLYSAFKLESEISSDNIKLSSEDCYSDEDIKELIEYARKKGVEVVPEIDTPAHSMAITKLFPEYGFSGYPELADSLDVTNPEAVEFVKSLWSYYLNGKDIFDGCNTINLGMDEYFGDNAAYSRFLSDMCSYVGEIAPEKKIRVWASLTYNDVDVSSLSKNIEMMVWRPICADPLQTYKDGFGVINCLNKNLYIIVDGGLDRIDVDNLINNWEPNIFRDDGVDETIPNWSPKMLGACYCMWNDNYCRTGAGPSEDSLYDRFEEPIEVLSNKLWNR